MKIVEDTWGANTVVEFKQPPITGSQSGRSKPIKSWRELDFFDALIPETMQSMSEDGPTAATLLRI